MEPVAIVSLSLPPEASFNSFAALLEAAQPHAKSAGYAFVTKKSEKRNGRQITVLQCKRGSIYRTSISNED